LILRASLKEQDPVTAILGTALEWPADLIVMGTHGRTGWRHALLGSVAEKLVRSASCPVMTVHKQD
jgi:nucleotide-binding universal stress UspA family protein